MRRFAAPLLMLALMAACSDESPVASRDSRSTNHEAMSPAIGQTDQSVDDVTPTTEATTTTEAPVPPTTVVDWGPVLCPALAHPAHHKPCPASVAPRPAPAASGASSTRSAPAPAAPGSGLDCGGSLPSCATMAVESTSPAYPNGGDPAAVNPTGCGGRGCYGKWQFDPVTSRGLGYDKTMDQYPVEVQDEAARQAKAQNACAWGC